MIQVINILIKNKQVDFLRKKYDSLYKKFKTHMTLVYPFEINNQKALSGHIKNSILGIKPFKIKFGKFYSSKNYLCLEVMASEPWQLYKNLNQGVLSGFDNKEVKFRPHVTICVLKKEEESKRLVKILNKNRINSEVILDSITLLNLNKDSSINSKKTFKLTKT